MIRSPNAVFSRQAVLTKPCPVPSEPGAYAWFFKEIPGTVPASSCVTHDGLTLLYIGISPKDERSHSLCILRPKCQRSGSPTPRGGTGPALDVCLSLDPIGRSSVFGA